MSPRTVLHLYLGAFAYAAGTFLIGDLLALLTIWLGFGLLMIVYYWLEWVATPALALVMGYQVRSWSLPRVISLGAPLVTLYAVVTPVFATDSDHMHLSLPWLSVYSKSKSTIVPMLYERLTWWGVLFLIGIAVGLVRRLISGRVERAARRSTPT